ncbi:MAG: ThuA domain-containing protein [Acidobacteriota bacterium]
MTAIPVQARSRRLLVVTVTEGFRHSSIETAERVLLEIAVAASFTVEFVRTPEDLATHMTVDALRNLDGVIFANTTGELPLPDREAFLDWIAQGHAFIGIHSAADTFHEFAPYLDMLGGEFDSHGDQAAVIVDVLDPDHPAARSLDPAFSVFDEIYLFKRFDRSAVNVVLSLGKEPNSGTPGFFPIAWCKDYGQGRVFYTALGHREDVWESPSFREHLAGAIAWATSRPRWRLVPLQE